MGLWSMVILIITLRYTGLCRCCKEPERLTNFLCFPVQVKQKWYPLLILLLLSIMQIQLDMLVACALGYLESYYLQGQLLKIGYTR